MKEVYDYASSAPRRQGILDMSRGTKIKAVSGEKGSLPQDESGSGEMKMVDLIRMICERMDSRFDEQDKRFNNRFHEQEKRFKEMDSCFEAFQERKTGELEGIATEAGERRDTPPEP